MEEEPALRPLKSADEQPFGPADLDWEEEAQVFDMASAAAVSRNFADTIQGVGQDHEGRAVALRPEQIPDGDQAKRLQLRWLFRYASERQRLFFAALPEV